MTAAEKNQRGWFWGGLAFAFGGILSLSISIIGWVTIGFMVQDNTQATNSVSKGNINGASAVERQLARLAEELAESNRIERIKNGISDPKRHSSTN